MKGRRKKCHKQRQPKPELQHVQGFHRKKIVTAISPDRQFYSESSGIEITLQGNEPEFNEFLYLVAEWMDRLELERFIMQRHPDFPSKRPVSQIA